MSNAYASGSSLRTAPIRNRAAMLAALLATMQVVGCQSQSDGPTPDTVRNTGQTAPADLQLTCASAAATPLGVDSAAVLPVSSSQIDAQTFQVVLESGGVRANCLVDTSGNVISVQKV